MNSTCVGMDYSRVEHLTILSSLLDFLFLVLLSFWCSLVKQPTSKSAEEEEEEEEEVVVESDEEAEDVSQEDIVVDSEEDVIGPGEESEVESEDKTKVGAKATETEDISLILE